MCLCTCAVYMLYTLGIVPLWADRWDCVLCLWCVYACVYMPLFLNTSRVPPLSRMGQQVSRSLARTLPVLFRTNWLPRRGCQSSQPFPSHPTALQPLWPQLHSFYSNDMNKYSLLSLYYTLTVFFIIILYNFTCILHVFYVYSSVFWQINQDNVANFCYVSY